MYYLSRSIGLEVKLPIVVGSNNVGATFNEEKNQA
jgi:hypothetical protein